MSTLGFMMAPSQYGMSQYGNPQSSYSNGYPPQQSYDEPRSSTSGPYGSPYSSSPAPNESRQRRPEQHAALPPYQPQHPSLPRSPYQQQQSADSIRANNAPMASVPQSYTYSAPQNNSFPTQPLGNNNYPPYDACCLCILRHPTECSTAWWPCSGTFVITKYARQFSNAASVELATKASMLGTWV
ncbi:hypothetical protein CFE70_005424 [Pyrenophora teres f. teres 0-1]